jgi:anaerobic ribonucleoside-triphosphate reductase activating protein
MNSTSIRLSRLHFPVNSLGPGRRIGIWLQGCSIRCPGCISMDTWEAQRGHTTVESVLEALEEWLADADGFTVSGGEPFDQPEALRVLLSGLRERHSGDILVYSGYPLEDLPIQSFSGLFDAVISDPFEIDAPQTRAIRGSDNQRLTALTPLGRMRFDKLLTAAGETPSPLDLFFDHDAGDVFIAGVPRRGDLLRLQRMLLNAGHKAGTTEDPRTQ